MIEQDTVKLLRECDAGIKMGVASIGDVQNRVHGAQLLACLTQCKEDHEELNTQIRSLLGSYHDGGKNPNPIARGMSRMKTGMKMKMNPSDSTVADLMTDGCNMGVKSLSRYLNQYKAADEQSKDITKRLIGLEEKLAVDMRPYL